MDQSTGDQVEGAPLPTQDFGLSCHFRLEQQGVIINLRADEDGSLCAAG
jgi:hypothetical protein